MTNEREQLREERREQILAAAITLFAQKGFHQTSMNDIVAETGLSKGGLYWHFKSKDEIITAILVQFFSQEMVELENLLAAPGTTAERILLLVSHATQEMEQMAMLQSIAIEFYAVAARQEDVRNFLRGYFQEYTNGLAALIQQGLDRGELAHAKAEDAATTLVAMLEGLALLYAVSPADISLKEQAEAAAALLLRGLQP